MLDRATLVRALVAHPRDDARLRIIPANDLDSSGFAQRGISPVGSDNQSAPKRAAIGEIHGGACIAQRKTRRFGGRDHGDGEGAFLTAATSEDVSAPLGTM